MANKKKNIFIFIGGIIVTIFGYLIYQHLVYVETDNAQIEAHTFLIATKVPGYIVKVNVSDGSKVKKGDLLVQIDDRDFHSALEAAKSEVLSLEARKKELEKNYLRLKDLFAKSVVSQQQFDSVTASYHEVKAKYDAAVAKATQSELNLEYSQIKAPSDGIVAKASAEVGQLANSGSPLVGFVSSDSRWVIANFKETEISDVKIGKQADITVDALGGKNFKGQVESISSATGALFSLLPPDNATGNFTKVVQRVPVKIKLLDLNTEDIENLQAGLSANVKVHIH